MSQELQEAARLRARSGEAMRRLFADVRLGNAIEPSVCAPLVDDVMESINRHPDALLSLARLKTADEYTYMHSVAVCALMVALGRQLGLNDAQCHEAGMAGMLHDLGKAAMPQEILNKPGKLTPEEFDIIKQHAMRGYEMLVAGANVSEGVLDVCRHHHERWDGTGYPDGLAGEQISLLARMGAVCDVYDAVTSDRPYKAGWDPAHSLSQMATWKGHFDTTVFQSFVKSIGIYPTGSLVRMRSGRLAVVLEQNSAALTKPQSEDFLLDQGRPAARAPGSRPLRRPHHRPDRSARVTRELEFSLPHRTVGCGLGAEAGSLTTGKRRAPLHAPPPVCGPRPLPLPCP